MNELIILSNSPGEVTGWVRPTAEALAARSVQARTILAALPCQYASGMEAACARRMTGIDEAAAFRGVWRCVGRSGGKTLILQLGGDPMFGAVLKLKTGGAWMIYSARPRWKHLVDYYFTPAESCAARFQRAGVSADKYSAVGNLILDSVPDVCETHVLREKFGLADGEFAVSFLPGSRPFEYRMGVPFFARSAQNLIERWPECRVLMPLAPTVDEEINCRSLSEAGFEWSGSGAPEEIRFNGGGWIRFVRGDTMGAVKASRLAVALPGTNNLQIAAVGTPLMVVAPLNEAHNIPLDGLAGAAPLTPKLKSRLVRWYNDRERFVSLPNRLTGREIVPEHRKIMTPENVADLASDLLESPEKLAKIKEGYAEIPLERGAADKIAAKAAEYFANKK